MTESTHLPSSNRGVRRSGAPSDAIVTRAAPPRHTSSPVRGSHWHPGQVLRRAEADLVSIDNRWAVGFVSRPMLQLPGDLEQSVPDVSSSLRPVACRRYRARRGTLPTLTGEVARDIHPTGAQQPI